MSEINFFWYPLADNILQEQDETDVVTAPPDIEPDVQPSTTRHIDLVRGPPN